MFKDYKVVITGATSGIGLATARKFLEEGATVIGIGRNFDATKDLGDRFIPFRCDVSKESEIDAAAKFIEETFGGELDTFVNNAGAGVHSTVKDVDMEEHRKGMDLLLNAPIQFGRNLYPMLLKSPRENGCIVNIASAAGHSISPDLLTYTLAKTAHIRLTEIQAAGFIGVRVNSVCPGYIDTPIFGRPGTDLPEEAIQAAYDAVSAVLPLGRIGQPEEVAEVIAFLCSEDAMYINGADVRVDGGFTAVVSG
ncbi:MAG: SDR family oxidoreductase [Lachnospiraceae bacterium]|nr:SDR family oxidoreductase [Lachnospiraceae bacterium]